MEDFFKAIEEIFDLANNGQGMAWAERLRTIASCLTGSRKQIYDNIIKSHETDLKVKQDPKFVYFELKERLMKFLETPVERAMRARTEYDKLTKTKGMKALQFEAKWEACLSELAAVGLPRSTYDKYLDYFDKIGVQLGESVRIDRRPRPDGAGGMVTRPPETWEEAHFVVIELEGIRQGTKAIHSGPTEAVRDQWPGWK